MKSKYSTQINGIEVTATCIFRNPCASDEYNVKAVIGKKGIEYNTVVLASPFCTDQQIAEEGLHKILKQIKS